MKCLLPGDAALVTTQGNYAIAIGASAGLATQGTHAIATGTSAGKENQSPLAIAIGFDAGRSTQGENTVAIGNASGYEGQRIHAVALGNSAGRKDQGTYSIAIGYKAGYNNQPQNSIVLNATGNELHGATQSATYIDPIRSITGSSLGCLVYDSVIKNTTTFLEINKPAKFANADASTTFNSGAVIVTGGLGIGGNLYTGRRNCWCEYIFK